VRGGYLICFTRGRSLGVYSLDDDNDDDNKPVWSTWDVGSL
jgi:hypothetical protein